MSKSKLQKVFSLFIVVALIAGSLFTLVACVKGDVYDNEVDPLVFTTQEVDKVFNPFFSTSAMDSNVVGMTQIGMLSNDRDGKPVYGDDEAVVAKDYQMVTNNGEKDKDLQSTYYFVLKNNVKFSDGKPLAMKDVLFNLYVYLDPVYTGSSTIYSTDIVGLKSYRTQESNPDEQDYFTLKYRIAARTRIDSLVEATSDILKKHMGVTIEGMRGYLENEWLDNNAYKNVLVDFDKTLELFQKELEEDYSNSLDSYQDQIFSDKEGTLYKNLFTTDVEMFLYNEGCISWDQKEAKLHSSFVSDTELDSLKNWTKEEAIEKVYKANIPGSITQVLQYWMTATTLFDYIVGAEMEADRPTDGETLEFPNIEGIKFANFSAPVTVNNKEYAVPQYNADGSVKEGYNEVLSITIHNEDPKAIWNFSFAIAPMHYYSDPEKYPFDYANNKFGVEYKSQSFLEKVVKDPEKIGVPVGAGPYAASKSAGGIENIKAGDFYDKGVIYFERNPYFVMGAPKIKKVRFQVVSSNSMLDSLYTKAVDFAEPNAKPETRDEIKGKKSEGLDCQLVKTLGYGYIGVNAGKVPNIYVRRAIMYAIDTSLCVSYYKSLGQAIYRSMSYESWAYPKNCVAYYPYIGGKIPADYEDLYMNGKIDESYYEYMTAHNKKGGETLTEDEQIDFINWLMTAKAGYTISGTGLYAKNGNNECKFEFTIAGQETDHPAYSAMLAASNLLNKCNFGITVKTDKDALKKLSTGSLTVWAAAWGSTIDPDMYQVYHKDSTATSVQNWGYKQILGDTNRYPEENLLIDELSKKIEDARSITSETDRALIYSDALDIVMKLAIELPTYQRNDLFAYNYNKIDVSTFYANPTSLKGLTTDMHNISLVVER